MVLFRGREGTGKLVRDTIDTLIEAQGHYVKTRNIDQEKLAGLILGKYSEELAELAELADAVKSGYHKEIVEELADLRSLALSLQGLLKISDEEVNEAEANKSVKKGSFTKGIFIEYIELNPEGEEFDFWLDYFHRNDQYTEE